LESSIGWFGEKVFTGGWKKFVKDLMLFGVKVRGVGMSRLVVTTKDDRIIVLHNEFITFGRILR